MTDQKDEGRYIRGGGGSHWDGCEETHWDCKILAMQKQINALEKTVILLTDTVIDLAKRIKELKIEIEKQSRN